jgi:hypothetical protein
VDPDFLRHRRRSVIEDVIGVEAAMEDVDNLNFA